MARTIYVGVVTNFCIVFDVRSIDCNTTLTLFRSIIDLCEVFNFTTVSFVNTAEIAAVKVVLP